LKNTEAPMVWNLKRRKKSKSGQTGLSLPDRKKWKTGGDVKLVKIADIVVPQDFPEPDSVLVAEIAESIKLVGLIHTVAVTAKLSALGRRSETVLVAGRARLEAYKLLGRTKVPCSFFENDDDAIRLVQLSENLFRKKLTVLQESEEIAECVELINRRFSGQNVRKKGRSPGGVAQAARVLPLKAKTEEGRRKKIERATKISEIWLNIKDLVREKGLDNDQAALLKIAEADDIDDQRKLVRQLSDRRTTRRAARKERMTETMPEVEQQEYEVLLAAWDGSPKFRTAWRKATKEHKERFINEVLRGSSGFDFDEAANLVQRAFAGRPKILVRDLQRLGTRHGFHKKTIATVVKYLGYKKKRLSRIRNDPWYYINTNNEWKNQSVMISTKEFEDFSPPKVKEYEPVTDDDDDDDERPGKNYRDEDAELDELDDLDGLYEL
jgi:ParB-like chromosome segregation protein Spo0J